MTDEHPAAALPTGKRSIFPVKTIPGLSAVAVISIAVLYAPVFALVVHSFHAGDSGALWQGFSLKWYVAALENREVREAFMRSLTVAASASAIATVAATMAAVARTRTFPGRTAIHLLINQPVMMPEIIMAAALLIVFASIKAATGYAGLGYLILAHAAFCVPFAYLPVRARLESIDLNLEMAAADLYATPWQAFRRITLPLMAPGIAAGAILAFVISLDDVIISEFVKAAGQDTLPTYMLGQLRQTVTPEINAISTALIALTAILLCIFFVLSPTRERKS